MKQKITQYIKKAFSGVNHPVLIAAILISFALWYLNKLGHNYTATIAFPLSIVNSPESPVGVLQNEQDIECRINGSGFELLKYRLQPKRNRLVIDLKRLELRSIEGTNRSEVTHSSLFSAVSEQLSAGQLQSIATPSVEIETAPFNTKKVPVLNRMEFEYRNQYMPIGSILFSPDSILVKSLDFLLDTLQAVHTEYRHFTNVNAPISGSIPLQSIPNVIFPINEVAFGLAVEEYTEIDLKLPLNLLHGPEGRLPVILPGEVGVRLNVARNKYSSASSGEIRAFIDYEDRITNVAKQYKVHVPVPEGIIVKEITPLYVELIFEEL